MLDQVTRTSPHDTSAVFALAAAPVASALDRALAGQELCFDEVLTLLEAQGPSVFALALAADELRRRIVGDAVTYVVNRNINFTNICYVKCRFCAFCRNARDDDAFMMAVEEVAGRAAEAWQAGATEVCIQGGLHPALDGFAYRDILLAIKARVPGIHIHAFSPMEIVHGAGKTGMELEAYLRMLKDAGLDSMPGTAAEILVDEVRKVICPHKLDVAAWTHVIRTAHRIGIPTTSTIMYGHVETPAHCAQHLLLIREIQKETGGFSEFVPLGFIHHNTPLFKAGLARAGASGLDDLKMHAVARLTFGRLIPNVQVSWVKLGPKFAQVCLGAGANDFGGTLGEENISKSAGATAGESMPAEEFRRLIREIGRVPAERTTLYEIRQTFENSLQEA